MLLHHQYQPDAPGLRVARGGSWRDRPFRATAGFRFAYRPYQAVLDVGFRVIVEEDRAEFPLAKLPPPASRQAD